MIYGKHLTYNDFVIHHSNTLISHEQHIITIMSNIFIAKKEYYFQTLMHAINIGFPVIFHTISIQVRLVFLTSISSSI